MARDLGDRLDGSTIDFTFHTVNTTGAPTQLAGTPVLSVYKDNNTTQTTTGPTLTVDFDSVTGFNHVRLALTDAFYVVNTDYMVVITTGTVGGTSVVGYVLATFSIEKRFNEVDVTEYLGSAAPALVGGRYDVSVGAMVANVLTAAAIAANAITAAKIAAAAITVTQAPNLDAAITTRATPAQVNTEVDTALADVNLDHLVGTAAPAIAPAGTYIDILADDGTATYDRTTDSLQAIRDRGDVDWTTGSGTGLTALASGTAQGGTASTIQFASGESFADDELNGNVVKIHAGTGAGQARVIIDYAGGTDTATVTPNWITNPDATSQYEVVEGSMNIEAVSNVADDIATETTLTTRIPNVLNTTALGNIGVDWANVENPTTPLDLAGTDIQLVDTTTTNTDMRGTDSAALASVLGGLADSAAADDPTIGDTLIAYVKQLINILIGAAGIANIKAAAAPANAVSLSEMIRAIYDDSNELQGDWVDAGRLDAILDARMAEASINTTAGAIDNVTTVATTTTNTDMVGTDDAALASVLGALADSAAVDDPTSADTLMAYAKQLINILIGAAGIGTIKAAAAPANGVSLSEIIRSIYDDSNELQGDWVDAGRLDAILDARAATGDAMALTSAERDSVADAFLDRTNGIETSLTPRQAFRLMSSALFGELSGAGTTTITIEAGNNPGTNRIVATVDASENRTALTLTP